MAKKWAIRAWEPTEGWFCHPVSLVQGGWLSFPQVLHDSLQMSCVSAPFPDNPMELWLLCLVKILSQSSWNHFTAMLPTIVVMQFPCLLGRDINLRHSIWNWLFFYIIIWEKLVSLSCYQLCLNTVVANAVLAVWQNLHGRGMVCCFLNFVLNKGENVHLDQGTKYEEVVLQ